jgi:hypothetical protein
MADHATVVWLATMSAPYLTVSRMWLERFSWLVPAPTANRGLLFADLACLLALALASGRPRLAVPLALGMGFLAVNVAGMALTDFYLGLALMHLATGGAAAVFARRWRWVGIAALCLTLALGILT